MRLPARWALAAGVLVLAASGRAVAQPTSYDVITDVRIPMSDGVLLDSDEYVPTTGCPCPTILVQTPYRKSGDVVAEGNPIFPSNGYAMIVVDVRGTGSSEITAGTLVASLRALGATPCRSIVADCSVYGGGQLIEPWHPYTRASQVPLVPGNPTRLDIEIFPTTAVIEPGHSLRLTVATGDFPHETSTLSTTVGSAGVDTLYLGPDHPSSVYFGTVSPAPAS